MEQKLDQLAVEGAEVLVAGLKSEDWQRVRDRFAEWFARRGQDDCVYALRSLDGPTGFVSAEEPIWRGRLTLNLWPMPPQSPYLDAMVDEERPKLFENRWVDPSNEDPRGPEPYRDRCSCFNQYRTRQPATPATPVGFHPELQDTSSAGWQHLLALIDEAASDGREEFRPLADLSPQERRQIVTLPPSIAKLTAVKHLMLYGSNLVRIPPEIGAMTSLEEFTPYTSHRLHWFPYEITRCSLLARSTVSTRSLFGNYKLRPPFPRLQPPQDSVTELDTTGLDPTRWGTSAVFTCSVCGQPMENVGLHQAWISLRVATDVLPLLVNACSSACVAALPAGAKGHVQSPHQGGQVDQPAPGRG